MSTHDVTIIGPHQAQNQLFSILEANRELRPVQIFAVSGASAAVQLKLDDTNPSASERFLETVWTHDPSSVEAISITTHDSDDVSGRYAVHHPGATGWKPVLNALAPSPEVYFLGMITSAKLMPELLTELSNRFTDATGKTLPSNGITFGGGEYQNVSVRIECSFQEMADILKSFAQADPHTVLMGSVTSGRDQTQRWSVRNFLAQDSINRQHRDLT